MTAQCPANTGRAFWLVVSVLTLVALLAAAPAKGWTLLNCTSSANTDIVANVPATTFNITPNMTTGHILGIGGGLNQNPSFMMCVTGINGVGAGASYNLYVGADKPAATFPAPGIDSITNPLTGLPDTVFTTDALQAIGLGYIVFWKAAGLGTDSQWVSPPANWGTGWMPPATTGFPFYQTLIKRFSSADSSSVEDCATQPTMLTNSLQGWWNLVNSSPDKRYCLALSSSTFFYYVLIKPANQIAHQLDTLSPTVTTQLAILKGRPGIVNQNTRRLVINHTVNLIIKPLGTCTTPSVVVPLGTLYPSDLTAPGPATTPATTFDLVLKDCPRINVRYFFRTPPGYTVDNTNGVLRRTSPPLGHAQGVGVQLAHNGGVAGTDPVQFNQGGNTTTYTRTPAMGQNDPVTGITHTIPMRASVYRTSTAPVVPGSINAAVWVYIQYP